MVAFESVFGQPSIGGSFLNHVATELGLHFDAVKWLPISIACILLSGIGIWAMQRNISGGIWSEVWRWLAICCIAISLAKPVIIRPVATAGGRWIFLVDQSRSMGVNDPQQSVGRCVALAQAEGLLQPQSRPLVDVELINQARTMVTQQDSIEATASELDIAQLSGHGVNAAAIRLSNALRALRDSAETLAQSATSQPNAVRLFDACRGIIRRMDEVGLRQQVKDSKIDLNSTHWLQPLRQLVDSAQSAAEQPQEVADEAIYRDDADVRAAADQVAGASRIANTTRVISQLIADRPGDVRIETFAAGSILEQLSIDPDHIATTDGEKTDSGEAIEAAEKIAQAGEVRAIFLFSDGRQVKAHSSSPPLNLPIIAVNCGVYARNEVSLTHAELQSHALVHESVPVHIALHASGMHGATVDLNISDGQQQWSQTIACFDGRTNATMFLHFDSPGIHPLVITAIPSTPDAHPQNDVLHRSICVVNQKIDLGLFAGRSSEDSVALRNGLSQTPWLQQRDWVAAQPMPDVLILHDVQANLLDESQWKDLVDWVKAGGGLILVAGPDLSVDAFRNSAAAALLPWREQTPPQWIRAESGEFHLAAVDGSIITRFSENAAENRARWEQLPAIHGMLPIDSRKPSIQPLLFETASNQAVVTEERLEAGRIVFVGFSEAFRWRNQFGDQQPDQFWLSLIHRVAEAPYAVRNNEFELDADPSTGFSGTVVNVRVKSSDERHGEFQPLQLIKNDVVVGNVPLHPLLDGVSNRRFVGMTSPLEVGDYQLRLQATPPLDLPLRIEPDEEAEMMNLNPDDGYLRHLATASGGEYLRLDEISQLPNRIDEMRKRSPRMDVVTLWDSAMLYWIVVGCLTLDWAGRKRIGLF